MLRSPWTPSPSTTPASTSVWPSMLLPMHGRQGFDQCVAVNRASGQQVYSLTAYVNVTGTLRHYTVANRLQNMPVQEFLPARRYASAGTNYGPVSVCCLCRSQVGVLSKRTDGLIWFLAWGLLSTSTTLCFKEIQVSAKNNVTSLWNFFLSSGLRKFRHGISIVKTCYQLSSRKVDAGP